MAEIDIRYNLSELFRIGFGINNIPFYITPNINIPIHIPVNYQGNMEEQPGELPAFRDVRVKGINYGLQEGYLESSRMSSFGTPVIFPFKIEAGTYTMWNLDGTLREETFGEVWMPAASLVDFNRSKIINKTRTLGGTGTVKEIYGLDDWQISIRGFCLDEYENSEIVRTALQQENLLLTLSEVAGSVKVSGSLFFMRGIEAMDIESIDIKSIQSKPNIRQFEMRCSANQVIELFEEL